MCDEFLGAFMRVKMIILIKFSENDPKNITATLLICPNSNAKKIVMTLLRKWPSILSC